ncbi:MAG TPA: hypothetical protein PKZ53_24570, partial [Acidobacteriota bacterium]|nr:hypothetical protein [Acidobacteriota bacterium]
MDNILIVTGGNGTKMAEATVRLLATGFPTQSANGTVTSIGDTLQIWRVDPDRSSGALSSLQRCLDEYKKLQHLMNDGNGSPRPTHLATSPWAMEVNTHIKDFDPFKLTKQSASIKNLRELLGKAPGKNEAKPILNAFYENKDLEVEIDRGFYQKPFIGAPVMAAFAESLDNQNSPAGELINLNSLKNREVRFFLCGSIYGGTGASALPVLGQFLAKQKLDHDLNHWKIGGCVLMPYCLPPAPPFNALPEHEQNDPVRIREESFRLAQIHASHPAFINLTIEERHKLARQILQGFYADPKGLHLRARHSLVYYSHILKATFDELYLVGKPEPDELKVWSNGGQSQTNPLNSAEVVAAISALNFFSGTEVCRREAYGLTTGTAEMQSQALRLSDLPCYKVNEQVVDPEKVVLATSLLIHLLKHQIQWGHDAQGWDSDPGGLRKVYEMSPDRQRADRVGYETALN